MDKISNKYKSQIEQLSFAYTKRVLNGDIGIVFYDMTTIYFESSQGYKFILAARVKNESAQIIKAVEKCTWTNGMLVEYTKLIYKSDQYITDAEIE